MTKRTRPPDQLDIIRANAYDLYNKLLPSKRPTAEHTLTAIIDAVTSLRNETPPDIPAGPTPKDTK